MVRSRTVVLNSALPEQQQVQQARASMEIKLEVDVVSPSERREMSELYEAYRLADDKAKSMYDMLRKVSHPMRGEQADIDAALTLIGHREGNVLQFDELLLYANATKLNAIAELGKSKMSTKQQTTLEAFVMLGGHPDGSGHVMLENLIATLQSFKLTVNVDALREILDKDGNGQVDLEEFSWFYNDALAAGALNTPNDGAMSGNFKEEASMLVTRRGDDRLVSEPSSGNAEDDERAPDHKPNKHHQRHAHHAPKHRPSFDDDSEKDDDDDDDVDVDDESLLNARSNGKSGMANSPGVKSLALGGGSIYANDIMKKLQLALQSHSEANGRRPGSGKNNNVAGSPLRSDTSGPMPPPGADPPRTSARAPARPVSSAPVSRSSGGSRQQHQSQNRALVPYVAPPVSSTCATSRDVSATPSKKQLSSQPPPPLLSAHQALMTLTTKKHQTDAKVAALQKELDKRILAAQQAAAELQAAQKEQDDLHEQVLREMRHIRSRPVKKGEKKVQQVLPKPPPAADRIEPQAVKTTKTTVAPAVTTSGAKQQTSSNGTQLASPTKNDSSGGLDQYSDSFDVTPPSSDTSSNDGDAVSGPAAKASAKRSSSSSSSSASSRHRSASTLSHQSCSSSGSAAKPSMQPKVVVCARHPGAAPNPSQRKSTDSRRPPPKHVAPVTPRALRLLRNVGGGKSPAPSSTRRRRSPASKDDQLIDMIIESTDAIEREKKTNKNKSAEGNSKKTMVDSELLKERNPYKELLVAACAAEGPTVSAAGDQMQLWTR